MLSQSLLSQTLKTFLFLIQLLFLSPTLFAQSALPEEQAFQFTANQNGQTINATWTIADGYYMYKDKMAFSINDTTVAVILPTSEQKRDKFFGDVAVYRNQASMRLPLTPQQMRAKEFNLVAIGQGCNDPIGVCYPPMTRQQVIVNQFVQTNDSGVLNSDILNSNSQLRGLLANSFTQKEFLDPDDAFKLSVIALENNQLALQFTIADGYYLYQDKIDIQAEQGTIDIVSQPTGIMRQDPYFGEVSTYENSATIVVEYAQNIDQLVLRVGYQGCAEQGICYAPINKTFDFGNTSGENLQNNVLPTDSPPIINSESYDTYKSKMWLIVGALLGGLLLTFTPCVLPLIPILSSIIAGHKGQTTKSRSLLLAILYAAGTITTYGAVGYLAGKTGHQLQAYFQNAWFIGLFSLLLFLLGLSMFGLFKIQIPSVIQNLIQHRTQRWGGHYLMTFLLGLFSALIVGACVSPILISFVGIAIKQADPWLGVQIMSALSLGMAIPLIIISLGLGHYLPRTGTWMVRVNQFFGLMLFAVAIYTLGGLPSINTLYLWSSYMLIVSLFLAFSISTNIIHALIKKIIQILSIALFIWAVLLLFVATTGKKQGIGPFISLSNLTQTSQQYIESYAFQKVQSVAQLQQALNQARKQNKAVIVDYYADWCIDCIRMKETTFRDKAVHQILDEKFVAIQIDVTENSETSNQLKKFFSVFGPPAVILIDANGVKDEQRSFYGYVDGQQLVKTINDL